MSSCTTVKTGTKWIDTPSWKLTSSRADDMESTDCLVDIS